MTKKLLSLWIVAFLLLAGCAPGVNAALASGQPSVSIAGSHAGDSSQPTAEPQNSQAVSDDHPHASSVDLTHLPIGDGHVSTQPEAGSVWSCQTSFNGGGAFKSGSWINGDGTFNLTAKPTIDGSVDWPTSFSISLQGDTRIIAGNDLPNHPTGTYPVSQADDAYAYDRNPNSIKAQTLSLSLPATPTVAAQPHCLPGGPVGVLLTGSYIFNALDAAGRDAVAHELQDNCQGHPEKTGAYHYHNLSTCVADTPDANGNSPLVGYALDGFGIFGPLENGQTLTNADLDACHGRTSEIEWDGQRVNMYHYVATAEYPYTIGCFRGAPLRVGGAGNGQPQPQSQQDGGPEQNDGQQQPQQGGMQRPHIDLAAAASKLGVTEEALRAALGDPSQGHPDLAAAAAQLGVTEQELIEALGLPAGGPPPQGNP